MPQNATRRNNIFCGEKGAFARRTGRSTCDATVKRFVKECCTGAFRRGSKTREAPGATNAESRVFDPRRSASENFRKLPVLAENRDDLTR
jgi:hypothetical protein